MMTRGKIAMLAWDLGMARLHDLREKRNASAHQAEFWQRALRSLGTSMRELRADMKAHQGYPEEPIGQGKLL